MANLKKPTSWERHSTKLDKKNIQEITALTPMQEGMLYHYLENPQSLRNFEQLVIRISGKIDVERFRDAWNHVIETNEMLRTLFRWEKVKTPTQITLKKHHLDFSTVELSQTKTSTPMEDRDVVAEAIEKQLQQDRANPFDLRDVPFRVTLCKASADSYAVIISNHHILYDGWSNGIILTEFFSAYNDLVNGNVPERREKSPFKEYVKWLRDGENEAEKAEQKAYWEDYLADFSTKKVLPEQRKRGATEMGVLSSPLDVDTVQRLQATAKELKTSLPVFLYTAWGLLLQHYNNCDDVIFDTSVSGRSANIKAIDGMVGLFIGTLPLRVRGEKQEGVSQLLARMNTAIRDWEAHENTSRFILDELSHTYRDAGLWESVLVVENYPLDLETLRKGSGFTIDSFSNFGITGYDLTLLVSMASGIDVELSYRKDLFTHGMAAQLKTLWIDLLKEMAADPRQAVGALSALKGLKEAEKEDFLTHIRDGWERIASAGAAAIHGEYVPPADEIEEKLLDLWSDVLKVNAGRIGVQRSFFQFGGHSLKATLLVSAIHKTFNVKIPLAEVFQRPTVRELGLTIKQASKVDYSPLTAAEEKTSYPLSSVQHRMVGLQQLDPDSTAYNVSTGMLLEGPLDSIGLEKAFNGLIDRHEIFRTSFHVVDGEPVQEIHEKVDFAVNWFEKPSQKGEQKNGTTDGEGGLKDILSNFIRPFDLSQAPLLRVGVCRLADEKHLLLLDMHHIVTDAFAMNIFINQFSALYKGQELPPVRHRYVDFAQWQHHRLKSRQLEQQEVFWLKELSGELPVLNLPTDFLRASVQRFEGKRLTFSLDETLTGRLNNLAGANGATLFMVLLAALNILLARYSGQEDIIIGTTVSGRSHADLHDIMGLFIETLALRHYPTGDKSFESFLKEVKEKTLAAFENEEFPFRELLKSVGDTTDVSRNPLFNVMLIRQDTDVPDLDLGDVTCTPVEHLERDAKVDITLDVFPGERDIRVELEYNTGLFKKETMERLARHFTVILEEVAENPGIGLGQVNMLTQEEQRQLLEDFKSSNIILPSGHGTAAEQGKGDVYGQIEEQVKRNPGNVAVFFDGKGFSYKELDKKVNKISKIIEGL